MRLQPVFQDCKVVGGAVAEALFRDGLCLPSGTALGEAEWARVVAAVRGGETRGRGDGMTTYADLS